jgi:hypothetical protein
MAGQVGHPHPPKNENAGVVGDIVQAALKGGGVHADVLIACPTLPRRRSEQDAGQGTPRQVLHQVLQVFSNRTEVAQVVMPIKQRVEQGALSAVGLLGQLPEDLR